MDRNFIILLVVLAILFPIFGPPLLLAVFILITLWIFITIAPLPIILIILFITAIIVIIALLTEFINTERRNIKKSFQKQKQILNKYVNVKVEVDN